MASSAAPRRTRAAVLAVLLLAAAGVAVALLNRSQQPSSTPAVSPSATAPAPPPSTARRRQRAVGAADGVVPDGTRLAGSELPAVTKLDPGLRKALRAAATDAADDGVTFYLNSGWRSAAYQNQLLRQAIAKYGSEREAARWVATADTSPHVSGDAVDLGRSDATGWLAKHGAEYGLCRIYRNEPWHFELRPDAVENGCPPRYADPTQDPRLN